MRSKQNRPRATLFNRYVVTVEKKTRSGAQTKMHYFNNKREAVRFERESTKTAKSVGIFSIAYYPLWRRHPVNSPAAAEDYKTGITEYGYDE